jgi:hypothetical protein
MDRIEWHKMFEAAVNAYEKVAFRPELPAEERVKNASRFSRIAEAFSQGNCVEFLLMQLNDADDRRRNTAARLLSTVDDSEATRGLWSSFLSRGLPRVSHNHVLRSARIRPLPVELATYLPSLDVPTQTVLIRALLAHPSADSRALLWSLVEDAGYGLGEVAVDAVASWDDATLLTQILESSEIQGHKGALRLPGGVRAALHLGLLGSEDALGWLIELARSKDARESSAACVSLGLLGRPEAVAEVDHLLTSSSGEELMTALEAADLLCAAGNAEALTDVSIRFAADEEMHELGNPADHATRILERLTGRSLPDDMAGLDVEGSPSQATRMRSAMLYRSVSSNLDAELRYLEGELLTLERQLEDLTAVQRPKMHRAVNNLRAATGVSHGFDVHEDLVGNKEAIEQWAQTVRMGSLRCDGDWWWHGEEIDFNGSPKEQVAS